MKFMKSIFLPKIDTYKTYIRPILFFGCENFFYTPSEISNSNWSANPMSLN